MYLEIHIRTHMYIHVSNNNGDKKGHEIEKTQKGRYMRGPGGCKGKGK